jgi:hypothetical protein
MADIDFKQKLSSAHEKAFLVEHAISREFIEQDVDLDRLFVELCYASEDRGAEVSVGTIDELVAVLSSDPYMPKGSLTPVGPSLALSWHGRIRKFCLGVDQDCDQEGGDGKKLRLLSWSGRWPDCTFEADVGVASIEEFFDRLVEEVAVIQQEAQTISRINEERDRRSKAAQVPPGSTIFWDRTAGVLLLAAIILSVHAGEGKTFGVGTLISGLLLFWTGLRNLKWAAETEGKAPKYGEGAWRVLLGAALVAMPALSAMLVTDISISPAIDCNVMACPGF